MKIVLRVAKVLTGKSFGSPEALKKYLQDHPKADRSKHTVEEKSTERKRELRPVFKELLSPLKDSHPEVGEFMVKHMTKEENATSLKQEIKRHEAATDKVLKGIGVTRKDLESFKKKLSPADKGAINKAVSGIAGKYADRAKKQLERQDLSPEEKSQHEETLRLYKSQKEEVGDLIAAQMMKEDKQGRWDMGSGEQRPFGRRDKKPKSKPKSKPNKTAALRIFLEALRDL